MAYIGLLLDHVFAASACGRSSAELHVTLAHLPEKTNAIPSRVLLDIDLLCAYSEPQAMTLGAMERFGSVMVRRAYGTGLEEMRGKVLDILNSHLISYSRDFEPWVPHCSIGYYEMDWHWINHGQKPAYIPHSVAVHASRLTFAGLAGVVSHVWSLGTAKRPRVPPTTLAGD